MSVISATHATLAGAAVEVIGRDPGVLGNRQDRGLNLGGEGEPEGKTTSRITHRGREGVRRTGGVGAHHHLWRARVIGIGPGVRR
jgi:hypothetical protein